MTYCIGKCRKYKALKPPQIGRYAAGQKDAITVNYS